MSKKFALALFTIAILVAAIGELLPSQGQPTYVLAPVHHVVQAITTTLKSNPSPMANSQPTSTSSQHRTQIWGQYNVAWPNTLMLVDAQGRRTGKDPRTGVLYREIPNTGYQEIPSNNSKGLVEELLLSDLPKGQYTLYVLGRQTGPYGAYIATSYGHQSLQGTVQAGSMDAYTQNYDPSNLASSTFSYSSTVTSTDSITSEPPNNLPRPLMANPPAPPPPPPPPAPVIPPPAPSSTEEINPPVISGLTAAVASTSVMVSWTTNKPATSQLLFGSSTAMSANIPADATFVTSHSIRVSYLAPGTTYYYEAQSIDAGGKTSNSAQQSFTTTAPASTTGM